MTQDTRADQDKGAQPPVTGGELVVQGLHRWSVDSLFCLPGVQLDALFDALYHQSDGIKVIHARHEQGAAYMALGYAMSTGRPGVCAVVPGPGVLNAGAALATGFACNARVVCLTSTIQSAFLGKKYGALHEIDNQTEVLRGLTKWTARATHASEIPALLDEAFRQVLSGRPRPVALEIPPDILAQLTSARYAPERPAIIALAPEAEAVRAAAALCQTAQRPMIVVGSGALDAGAEVEALATLLQAPVVSRNSGRGILSARSDLELPGAAALDHWAQADLVIGIGTRLQELREWGAGGGLKVIRIDVDHAEMTRFLPPDVAMHADAALGARALVQSLSESRLNRADRSAEIRATKDAFFARVRSEVAPQMAYIDVLRAALADDDVFVDEMTQVAYVARYGMPFYRPRSVVNSSYQGTLGYGFATALGAQVACPDRRVISINGDGGFMYTMPELATAVLHGIKLTAIVFRDNNFGNVRLIQKNTYGQRYIASNLHNPDFKALAETFGAVGMRAHTPAELEVALRESRNCEGPVLIEVPVDGDSLPSPWKFIHGRKVR